MKPTSLFFSSYYTFLSQVFKNSVWKTLSAGFLISEEVCLYSYTDLLRTYRKNFLEEVNKLNCIKWFP